MKKNKLKLFLGGLAMTLVLVGCSNVNPSDVKGSVKEEDVKGRDKVIAVKDGGGSFWSQLEDALVEMKKVLVGVADRTDKTIKFNQKRIPGVFNIDDTPSDNTSDGAQYRMSGDNNNASTNVLDKVLVQQTLNKYIYETLAGQCGSIIANQPGDRPHIEYIALKDVVAKEQGIVQFKLDNTDYKNVTWTVLPNEGLTVNIDEETGSATYSAADAGKYTVRVFIADAEIGKMYDYRELSVNVTSPFKVLGYTGVNHALTKGSFSFTLKDFIFSYNDQPIGPQDVTLEIGQGDGFRAGYATYTPESLAGEVQNFLQGPRTYVYSIEVDKNYAGAWMTVPLILHHQDHSIHHGLKIRIVDNLITVGQIPFIKDSLLLISNWYKDLMESWQKDDTHIVENSTTYMAYVEKLLTFLTDEERSTVNKYLTTMFDNYETETGYYIPFMHDMVDDLFTNTQSDAWITILKAKLMAWTYNKAQMVKEMEEFINYVIKNWNTEKVLKHFQTYDGRYEEIIKQAFDNSELSQALSDNKTLKFLTSDFVRKNWINILSFDNPTSLHDSLKQLIEKYHMGLGLVREADVSTFALTRLNNVLYDRGFYNLLWQYRYMDNADDYAKLGYWLMVDKKLDLKTILEWTTDKAMFESKWKAVLDEYTKTNALDAVFRWKLDNRVMRFMHFAVKYNAKLDKMNLLKNKVKESYNKAVGDMMLPYLKENVLPTASPDAEF